MDEADRTKRKYIVAGQYLSGGWNLYFGADSLEQAKKQYEHLCGFGADRYKAAAIFTRGQWYGDRKSFRYHKNLRNRGDESIPSALGMWIINQADAGCL